MDSRFANGSSVGTVVPQRWKFAAPFKLQSGDILPSFELVYETYGELHSGRDNAVLVCHALSGSHHAAGLHADDESPGWWDSCIGPGKPIDTDKFFVVCVNNIGGCHGSTGPASTNPRTGEPYGPEFPSVTVKDWVHTQAMLAHGIGIRRFAAVVGGSLGGMQAMQWAIDFPDRVEHAILVACAAKLSAQNIAFNKIARSAIHADPCFEQGQYKARGRFPSVGLRLARMLGHVTYLSDGAMGSKFGREIKQGDPEQGADVEFQVESYLHYQGERFSKRFDANSYLLITRLLDCFDPAREFGDDLVATLSETLCRFLVISFTSDWRFAPERSDEIVDALVRAGRPVTSAVIDSPHGHDSFLLYSPRYFEVLGEYFQRMARDCSS